MPGKVAGARRPAGEGPNKGRFAAFRGEDRSTWQAQGVSPRRGVSAGRERRRHARQGAATGRTGLSHARLLGYTRFRVRSDHLFHVRRYDEDLIHRVRRKSETLERLDTLVASLEPHVTFEYIATRDTDAPHRFANHARALHRLALVQPLSRSQQVALRRVHFALRTGRTRQY